MMEVPDIEVGKSEALTVCQYQILQIGEYDNYPLLFHIARSHICQRLLYTLDFYCQVIGLARFDGNPLYPVPFNFITCNYNACRIAKRHPCLHYLAMNQPVIYPDQYNAHKF